MKKYIKTECENIEEFLLKINNVESMFEINKNTSIVFEQQTKFNDYINGLIKKKEIVQIMGDYDVDGITSTAIVKKFLDFLKIKNFAFIPSRNDGFGISVETIKRVIKKGTKHIITVDNGASQVEAVRFAKEKGLTICITDHHVPNEEVIELADYFFNPRTENWEFNEISGSMTIYSLVKEYFIQTYESNLSNEQIKLLSELSELAIVGTIADVMPLKYVNRYMIKQQLKKINQTGFINSGLSSLSETLKLNVAPITAETIAYYISPVINAPGRLKTGDSALKLLLTDDEFEAIELTNTIIELNKQRQEWIRYYSGSLVPTSNSVEVFISGAKEGIIGILAGNLLEKTGKPVFVFTKTKGGTYKASARSIENFNIYESSKNAIENNETLKQEVINYGGHEGAMGITIRSKEGIELFRKSINAEFEKEKPEPVKVYYYDVKKNEKISDLGALLDYYEPFGAGFKKPLFKSKFKLLEQKVLKEKHVKITGLSETDEVIDVLQFNSLKHVDASDFEALFKISKNLWRGKTTYNALAETIN